MKRSLLVWLGLALMTIRSVCSRRSQPHHVDRGAQAGGLGGDSVGLVRKSLMHLPLEQRQAIELACFGGFSQSGVAERLREALGTIKARIRRGMLAMREALEGPL